MLQLCTQCDKGFSDVLCQQKFAPWGLQFLKPQVAGGIRTYNLQLGSRPKWLAEILINPWIFSSLARSDDFCLSRVEIDNLDVFLMQSAPILSLS